MRHMTKHHKDLPKNQEITKWVKITTPIKTKKKIKRKSYIINNCRVCLLSLLLFSTHSPTWPIPYIHLTSPTHSSSTLIYSLTRLHSPMPFIQTHILPLMAYFSAQKLIFRPCVSRAFYFYDFRSCVAGPNTHHTFLGSAQAESNIYQNYFFSKCILGEF